MERKPDVSICQLNIRVSHEFERLLKAAFPRAVKRHQLTKILQSETPGVSARDFERRILEFYKIPFQRRTERQFGRTIGVKPYPWLMGQFTLNFSNATVSETEMVKMASRLRHHIRFLMSPPDTITSVDFLHVVIHRTANPRWDQINTGIDLEIFADRWRKLAFLQHGDKYEDFFDDLDRKIDARYSEPFQPGEAVAPTHDVAPTTDLDLTQTDLDWMKEIIRTLDAGSRLPLYPLQRGPNSATVQRMEKLVRAAYRIFPLRHPQLEDVLNRACAKCLATFRQSADSESEQQCDTSSVSA